MNFRRIKKHTQVFLKVQIVQNLQISMSICCGWGSPLNAGLSDYNMESVTMDHSGQHHWRVSISQHAKDLIGRFRKSMCIITTTQDKTFHPYPTLHTFTVAFRSH